MHLGFTRSSLDDKKWMAVVRSPKANPESRAIFPIIVPQGRTEAVASLEYRPRPFPTSRPSINQQTARAQPPILRNIQSANLVWCRANLAPGFGDDKISKAFQGIWLCSDRGPSVIGPRSRFTKLLCNGQGANSRQASIMGHGLIPLCTTAASGILGISS